jgi:hypothetical protein
MLNTKETRQSGGQSPVLVTSERVCIKGPDITASNVIRKHEPPLHSGIQKCETKAISFLWKPKNGSTTNTSVRNSQSVSQKKRRKHSFSIQYKDTISEPARNRTQSSGIPNKIGDLTTATPQTNRQERQ